MYPLLTFYCDFLPYYRRKVLEGTTVVMSGLVPLSTDLMRYLFPTSIDNLSHDIHNTILCDYILVRYANQIMKYRSEIALQACNFGAELQTK